MAHQNPKPTPNAQSDPADSGYVVVETASLVGKKVEQKQAEPNEDGFVMINTEEVKADMKAKIEAELKEARNTYLEADFDASEYEKGPWPVKKRDGNGKKGK